MKMTDIYHSQIHNKVGGNDHEGNVDTSANSDNDDHDDYDDDCDDDNNEDGGLRSA